MILTDQKIADRVSKDELIIENYDPDNLNAISYDLTVDRIVSENSNDGTSILAYDLEPGQVVYIKSWEMLKIPYDIMGRIGQKNSRMRMGLYVDGPHYHPGHKTYAYLRVLNLSSNVIRIKQGDKIAQIIFETLDGLPNHTYDEPTKTFANEMEYIGMGGYEKEYSKSITRNNEVRENLENKEAQIYTNVLTLMGIIAALFSLITVNFEAFREANIDFKFVLIMNLSLSLMVVIFFGLLRIITSQKKNKYFNIIYIMIIGLLIVATGVIALRF